MTKSTRTLGIIAGTGLGLLVASAGFPATARADSPVGDKTSATTSETVVVTAIDRAAREVTLKDAHGDSKTVQVPPEVKAFDTVKVGDYVDIDYTESVAVSMLPPGSKPSANEVTGATRTGQGGGHRRPRDVRLGRDHLGRRGRQQGDLQGAPRPHSYGVGDRSRHAEEAPESQAGAGGPAMTYTEAMAMALRPTSPK